MIMMAYTGGRIHVLLVLSHLHTFEIASEDSATAPKGSEVHEDFALKPVADKVSTALALFHMLIEKL